MHVIVILNFSFSFACTLRYRKLKVKAIYFYPEKGICFFLICICGRRHCSQYERLHKSFDVSRENKKRKKPSNNPGWTWEILYILKTSKIFWCIARKYKKQNYQKGRKIWVWFLYFQASFRYNDQFNLWRSWPCNKNWFTNKNQENPNETAGKNTQLLINLPYRHCLNLFKNE